MGVLLRICIFSALVVSALCMWVKEMENPNLFQGDIVLDPDEHIHLINGSTMYASIKGGRWPGGKVPYQIEHSMGPEGVSVINRAIENYHKYTCIRFHKRTNERSYINFYKGTGCHSPIGYRLGRVNHISLGKGCQYVKTAMHEIGHSMGFWHEQMRPDRDKYIKIIWGNIRRGMERQFKKLDYGTIDSLGTPYDFSSMMHYGSRAFSSNFRKTILTLDPSKQRLIGQHRGFSEIDIKQLGLMYDKICAAGTGGGGGGGGGGTIVTKPPPTCDNKNERCEEWAKRGECLKDPPYMLNNCCKECKEFGCPGECQNKNEKCDQWASEGYCHGSHGYWMKCNCCIACKGK